MVKDRWLLHLIFSKITKKKLDMKILKAKHRIVGHLFSFLPLFVVLLRCQQKRFD